MSYLAKLRARNPSANEPGPELPKPTEPPIKAEQVACDEPTKLTEPVSSVSSVPVRPRFDRGALDPYRAEALRESFAERCAIMEYDGGMMRADAEQRAHLLVYGTE